MAVLSNLQALSVSAAEQTGGNANFQDVTGTLQASIVTVQELRANLTRLVAVLTTVNGSDSNISLINTIITNLA